MITIEEIEHIAKLSKLKFSKEEQAEVLTYLKDAIKQTEVLNSINTSNVVANAAAINVENLREDSVGQSLTQEQALANASQKRDGGFSVPQVID